MVFSPGEKERERKGGIKLSYEAKGAPHRFKLLTLESPPLHGERGKGKGRGGKVSNLLKRASPESAASGKR